MFWAMALGLGWIARPVQAASRTLMARLAPPREEGAHSACSRCQAVFNAFLGPAVPATVTAASGSQRLGMATILLFLGLGAVILASVPEPPETPRAPADV